ncbi:MAG: ABC transporter ATP-binding protein [Deltaproteobacteria bacterium]|nr:ABC transporter ATP-binding protein [Deltaproteobacteria bacterium]
MTSRREADQRLEPLLNAAGISDEILGRRPQEISGGQAQRVVIARALSLEPEYLIADEPTSMLDLSVQAMILNLLKKLQRERNVGIILISHDLSVIKAFCDKILILRNGHIDQEKMNVQNIKINQFSVLEPHN